MRVDVWPYVSQGVHSQVEQSYLPIMPSANTIAVGSKNPRGKQFLRLQMKKGFGGCMEKEVCNQNFKNLIRNPRFATKKVLQPCLQQKVLQPEMQPKKI